MLPHHLPRENKLPMCAGTTSKDGEIVSRGVRVCESEMSELLGEVANHELFIVYLHFGRGCGCICLVSNPG